VSHPHPDRRHVMLAYRKFILGLKAPHRGTPQFRRAARSQVKYGVWVEEYLEAKRDLHGKAANGKDDQ